MDDITGTNVINLCDFLAEADESDDPDEYPARPAAWAHLTTAEYAARMEDIGSDLEAMTSDEHVTECLRLDRRMWVKSGSPPLAIAEGHPWALKLLRQAILHMAAHDDWYEEAYTVLAGSPPN